MMLLPVQPASKVAAQGPVLRDIHLPPDPSWWPPAPGWWVLATLLLIALLAGVWLWRRHRRTLRRNARVVAELERFAQQHQQDRDHAALASGLHQLLRRVARRHESLAAQQRGPAWRTTLARMPVDDATLDRLLSLETAMYRPPQSFDAMAVTAAVRLWLAHALKPSRWKTTTTGPAHG
jgi:hypothetical protein